jgi:hypothetical protein
MQLNKAAGEGRRGEEMAVGCGGLAREAAGRQGGRSCRHACGDGGDAGWGQVLVGGRDKDKVKGNKKDKKGEGKR